MLAKTSDFCVLSHRFITPTIEEDCDYRKSKLPDFKGCAECTFKTKRRKPLTLIERQVKKFFKEEGTLWN